MKYITIALLLFASTIVRAQVINDTLKLTKSQLDTTLNRAFNAPVNIKEFGAKGDSITDDHNAIQTAITVAGALGKEIYVPPGKYRTSSGFLISKQNAIFIRGANRFTSIIKLSGSGNLFTFSPFQTNPGNSYIGTAQDYRFSDIRFEGLDRHMEDDGLRTRTGIQDNGSGGGILNRVAFSGFKYGFQGSYGSDFTRFTECYFEFCDTALYLGPNSNQFAITRTTVGNCVVGVIIDGAFHGEIDNFASGDNSVCDIMFHAGATNLSGVVTNPNWEVNCEVRNSWFEGNANGTGRIPPRHIWLAGDPAGSYPRYVKITNSTLISGGDSSATDAFVEMQTGIRMALDGLRVYGSHAHYAVKIDTPGYFPAVYESNVSSVDGYRTIKHYNVNQIGLYYLDPINPTVETLTGINVTGTLPIISPVRVEFQTPGVLVDSILELNGASGKFMSGYAEPFRIFVRDSNGVDTLWRSQLGWSESSQKAIISNRLPRGSMVRLSTAGVELVGSGLTASDTIAVFRDANNNTRGMWMADGSILATGTITATNSIGSHVIAGQVPVAANADSLFGTNYFTADSLGNIQNSGYHEIRPITIPAAPASGVRFFVISGGANADTIRSIDHHGNIKQIAP